MAEQLHRTFLSALESLPEAFRQLLALREFNGLDAPALAATLGISRAQARIDLFQAREQMRVQLIARLRPAAVR